MNSISKLSLSLILIISNFAQANTNSTLRTLEELSHGQSEVCFLSRNRDSSKFMSADYDPRNEGFVVVAIDLRSKLARTDGNRVSNFANMSVIDFLRQWNQRIAVEKTNQGELLRSYESYNEGTQGRNTITLNGNLLTVKRESRMSPTKRYEEFDQLRLNISTDLVDCSSLIGSPR